MLSHTWYHIHYFYVFCFPCVSNFKQLSTTKIKTTQFTEIHIFSIVYDKHFFADKQNKWICAHMETHMCSNWGKFLMLMLVDSTASRTERFVQREMFPNNRKTLTWNEAFWQCIGVYQHRTTENENEPKFVVFKLLIFSLIQYNHTDTFTHIL